ncbi:MAG TPA: tRNA (adenosine(37)-N6)-dimethylallyltransferase MiaA [Hyphomonadaceae bacterium]|jgi:tRNA dimethylallyltransferase|nr:tRNA (adenosine(37)-N6)-dimethylallyltransferase MiaA [Hyphomonadaceae bacterium]
MRPAILIHGPTASGKTRLAIDLAKRLGGEIINADAMQVYADLQVLSARPDAGEQAEAVHHMFGHVDAGARYSAGIWAKEASALIARLRGEGKIPVVVGGTGLYLMALTEGLSEIPPIPDEARAEARAKVAVDVGAAYAELIDKDPPTGARLDPNDRQRISRALEVVIGTGRTLSSFHGEASPILNAGEWAGVTLTPPRETIYRRINARVDAMMKAGALEEARTLWARQLDRELPAMNAHGMPGFCDYFDGKVSLEDAVERCKRDTRRYAKRQMTWIAHQFTQWPRVPSMAADVRTRVTAAIWNEVGVG